MKTIPLRQLVRQPLTVKRWTRAGQPVQITDNGRPLWILQPANGTDADEAERRRAIDEILDDVLSEKPSEISAAKLLEESRR
jgi:antitoxin (DNA-binding transcriptional repressor) of toxin-antitoxin stability system